MPVLAAGFAGRQELLIHIETTFFGIHPLINDVFDEALWRAFHRHLARLNDVQLLMNTGIFHDHRIAGFPVDPPAIMDVMALALEDVKYRAIHVAMSLAVAARRETIDVTLNRLRDLG